MRQAHNSPKKVKETKAFLIGVGVSAVNPSLIASWTFTATTIYSMKLIPFSLAHSLLFSGGVCVGIIAWFGIMMKIMELHRNNLDPKILDRGLKAVAFLLWGISLYLLIHLFLSYRAGAL